MGDYDEIKRSDFNEASLKMMRIHELQRIVNMCSVDKLGVFVPDPSIPIGFQIEGKRKYEVIFECLNQLAKEILGKVIDTDRAKLKKSKKGIRIINTNFKVFTPNRDPNGKKVEDVLDIHVWVLLEERIDEYEEEVRLLLDKHGYGGKESKDPRVAVTN